MITKLNKQTQTFIIHKHSLFSLLYHLIPSGNFQGLDIRHGIFWGLMFGPGVFGGFVGSPKDFFEFWFLPPSNGSSTHLTRSDKQLFMTLRKALRPNKSRVRDRKKGFCRNN